MMNKNKSLGIIFLSILGFCLTFFLLIIATNVNHHIIQKLAINYPFEPQTMFFNENPQFLLWIFIISILISISFGLLLPIISKMKEIVNEFEIKNSAIFLNTFLSFLIMGFIYFVLNQNQYLIGGSTIMEFHEILLKDPKLIMSSIVLLSFVIPIMGIVGMLIINHSISLIEIKNLEKIKELEKNVSIKRFILLSKSLDFFLMIMALIITGAIIATGKLRQSMIAIIGIEQGLIFPIEFVYIYGAFFTVLLAIIYIPIYNYLQITGKSIEEAVNQLPQGEAKKDGLQSSKIENILKTEHSAIDKLKVSFSIFAPILGSILPKLLEF